MSKLKYWPTAKIKEVLDENYNRGSTGRDYEHLKQGTVGARREAI